MNTDALDAAIVHSSIPLSPRHLSRMSDTRKSSESVADPRLLDSPAITQLYATSTHSAEADLGEPSHIRLQHLDTSLPRFDAKRDSDTDPFASPTWDPNSPLDSQSQQSREIGRWVEFPSCTPTSPAGDPPPFASRNSTGSTATTSPPPPRLAVPPTLAGLFAFTTRWDAMTLLVPGALMAMCGGLVPAYVTLVMGDALQSFSEFAATIASTSSPTEIAVARATLLHAAKLVALKFFVLGMIDLLLTTASNGLYCIHGARVVLRVQQAVYRSVASKPMTWFDTGMGKDMNSILEQGQGGDGVKADGEDTIKDGSGALVGNLTKNVNDMHRATSLSLALALQMLTALFVNLGLAFYKSWKLSLAVLVIIALYAVVAVVLTGRFNAPFKKDIELTEAASSDVQRAFSAITTIKAFNAESEEVSRFKSVMMKIRRNYRRLSILWGCHSGITEFLSCSMFTQGFAVGARLVQSGELTPGEVNTVFWACLTAGSMCHAIIPAQIHIEKGKVSMAALRTLIAAGDQDVAAPKPGVLSMQKNKQRTHSINTMSSVEATVTCHQRSYSLDAKISCPPLSPSIIKPTFIPLRYTSQRSGGVRHLQKLRPRHFSGELSLQNITFHYPARPSPAPPALYNVTLYIPPKETTYIVGASGCGKSTVAALLQNFYEPDQGEIQADEQGYEWLDPSWLRGHIGCVSQGQALIVTGTVHDNVALGVAGAVDVHGRRCKRPEDVTREEVITACRAAMVHEFVRDLPDGYDTVLGGEGGTNLSGGQRQRVALARAWLRNPTVLILDEALSALDSTTRVLVHAAIKQWRRNQTTVCITHDLAPIEVDDFVYIMRDGEVVQQGYQRDLASLSTGAYAEMTAAAAQMSFRDSSSESSGDQDSIASAADQNSIVTSTRKNKRSTVVKPALQKLRPLTLHSYNRRSVGTSLSSAMTHSEALKSKRMTIANTGPSEVKDKRFSRLSTVMLSGRQATIRRANPHTDQPKAPRRQWTQDQLDAATSLRVSVQPAENQEPLSIFRVTLQVIRQIPNRLIFTIGVIACIAHGISTPIFSMLLSNLMAHLDSQQSGFLLRSVISILCVSFLDGNACFLRWFLLETVGINWICDLRNKAFQKLIQQDTNFFDREQNSTTRLAMRLLKDGEEAKYIVAQVIGLGVSVFVLISVSFIWAIIVGWQLTLSGIALGPLLFLVLRVANSLSLKFEIRAKAAGEVVAVEFQRMVVSIRAIRSMSVEQIIEEKYDTSTLEAKRVLLRAVLIPGFMLGLRMSLTYFAESVMFFVGGVLVSNGTYSFAQMIQVFALIIFAVTFASVPSATRAAVAARDLMKLVDLTTDTLESSGKLTYPIKGHVKMEKVNFCYPHRSEVGVLKDLSLEIKQGECVAIVGASGSGKSTIAALLQRLYEPTTGTITLDDNQLDRTDVHYLRDRIAMVSQQPVLFDTTIAKNISYGDPNATHSQIQLAAQRAKVDDFIQTLPQTYNTIIGESASLISGGQAQRIQIARSLIRQRDILILDECTSSLDTQNQVALIETILSLKQRRTTIFITHKLDVMRKVDRLIVMSQGTIVEEGTFDDLVSRTNGIFATLARGGEWST